MPQLNVHLTARFERDLARLMRLRGLRSKSEAVRVAVAEALERAQGLGMHADFASWVGAAKAGANPAPRFRSDDDLWR